MAWISHLRLDTFYNHGCGPAKFWLLSEDRLVAYGTLFITAVIGRRIVLRATSQ